MKTRKQYKVLKVEFDMGNNDETDIRAGGPARLSFWVSTNLHRNVIKRIANSSEVQSAIKSRRGTGHFAISETWAESYIKTEAKLKERLLYWANRM